ncbi:HNH endonuclease [Symbiopectobacterium sp.]|uniref:HNH endonuclease n=1 Tax=Symbiopectobacterium sp. TaxID=2952789 RepID=UPI003F3C6EDF
MKKILNYDPIEGVFTWAVKPNRRIRIGDTAGTLHKHGYVYITINKKLYRAHRLAWFFFFGRWPEKEIDHINGVKNDNRISNLREATSSQNHQNEKIPKNNKSGVKGVFWSKKRKRYCAKCMVNRRGFYIGSFVDVPEAEEAVRNFRITHHGDFANHG